MNVKTLLTYPAHQTKVYLGYAGELGYKGIKKLLIACDIYFQRKRYHCFPNEYIFYRFDRLKPRYRREYLLRFDQYGTYAKVNFPTDMGGKHGQYQRFGELLGRAWMLVDPAHLDDVRAFAKQYGKVLFKPANGSCGVGIFTYEPARDSEEVLVHLLECCAAKRYLCEQYVVQHPAIAAFHPHSVNTVRVLSFNNGREIKLLAATLKLGISDCVVDNIRHEGLGANIDLDTGIVNTPGYNFDREAFYFHPESGEKIIGAQIPNFDKVKETVKKGAAMVPECAVIGWDIAVTADGVNIIEMNNRPGVRIIQMYDMQPRGKEIKAFAKAGGDRVRKLTRHEIKSLKKKGRW